MKTWIVLLTALTCIGQVAEAKQTPRIPMSHYVSNRVTEIKDKQAEHLAHLQALANLGQWQHLATHTAHPHSGFDWWMFPVDRPSASYGNRFALNPTDLADLLSDEAFMKSYREGVHLVVLSWGWNLATDTDVTSDTQHWHGWSVRLGKMAQSLQLFGENELHLKLQTFVLTNIPLDTLPTWVLKNLDIYP